MTQRRAHLWVQGHVQGVSFRHHARQIAMRLGLSGWVKNLADGQVEIVAEGDEAALRQLIGWCQRGPEWADVEKVEVRWEAHRGEFRQFGIAW